MTLWYRSQFSLVLCCVNNTDAVRESVSVCVHALACHVFVKVVSCPQSASECRWLKAVPLRSRSNVPHYGAWKCQSHDSLTTGYCRTSFNTLTQAVLPLYILIDTKCALFIECLLRVSFFGHVPLSTSCDVKQETFHLSVCVQYVSMCVWSGGK